MARFSLQTLLVLALAMAFVFVGQATTTTADPENTTMENTTTAGPDQNLPADNASLGKPSAALLLLGLTALTSIVAARAFGQAVFSYAWR